MAKIITFFTLISFLYADIIEVDQIDQILPYIDKTTWVLFNIDNNLAEPEIPSIVHLAQQSAGAVFGLTARQPPISSSTLKQLAYIGIDFTFSAPFCPNLETQTPTHWEGGVLFLTDFNRKADVFRKWLEFAPLRPSKLILIDEGKNNLIEMDRQMGELGIPCTSFYYTKSTNTCFVDNP